MKVTFDKYDDEALKHIKRLITEATRGDDGQIPVVRDNTWPVWIGAAASYLRYIVEQGEKSQS